MRNYSTHKTRRNFNKILFSGKRLVPKDERQSGTLSKKVKTTKVKTYFSAYIDTIRLYKKESEGIR